MILLSLNKCDVGHVRHNNFSGQSSRMYQTSAPLMSSEKDTSNVWFLIVMINFIDLSKQKIGIYEFRIDGLVSNNICDVGHWYFSGQSSHMYPI